MVLLVEELPPQPANMPAPLWSQVELLKQPIEPANSAKNAKAIHFFISPPLR